jgi:hypothetical protein
VALSADAVAGSKTTDFLFLQAMTLLNHAEVLTAAGQGEAWAAALEEAGEVAERKGFTVAASWARELSQGLRR